MKALRLGLLIVTAAMGMSVSAVLARQIPDASPTISDTRDSSGFEYSRDPLLGSSSLQRHDDAVDPVVLEPIRPLFPGDPLADALEINPAVCGRMNAAAPGVMLAGLLIFRVSGMRVRRKV